MSTELVPVTEAEIVYEATPLSETEAKALNSEIHWACEQYLIRQETLQDLLEQAYTGQIHVALSYPSWTAWFAKNVHITPEDKAERQLWAAAMSGRGMSQRAIAAVLGVTQPTVSNDLRSGDKDLSPDEGNEPGPDKTTGLDNKTYKRKPKEPEPEPKQPADPVEDDVQRVITHLGDVMRIVAALQENQQFTDEQFRRITTAVHELKNALGI
jgi:hypothetical protein